MGKSCITEPSSGLGAHSPSSLQMQFSAVTLVDTIKFYHETRLTFNTVASGIQLVHQGLDSRLLVFFPLSLVALHITRGFKKIINFRSEKVKLFKTKTHLFIFSANALSCSVLMTVRCKSPNHGHRRECIKAKIGVADEKCNSQVLKICFVPVTSV